MYLWIPINSAAQRNVIHISTQLQSEQAAIFVPFLKISKEEDFM